jgi:mono/diheme cytochrome c family protein
VRATRLVAVALATALVAGCGGGATSGQLSGHRIFVTAGCGHCHTLRAAGTHGSAGPDFDTSERLTTAQIRRAIVSGVNGMPSYAGRLSPRQIEAVSEFLYAATH